MIRGSTFFEFPVTSLRPFHLVDDGLSAFAKLIVPCRFSPLRISARAGRHASKSVVQQRLLDPAQAPGFCLVMLNLFLGTATSGTRHVRYLLGQIFRENRRQNLGP
jgi:hypothetical protein